MPLKGLVKTLLICTVVFSCFSVGARAADPKVSVTSGDFKHVRDEQFLNDLRARAQEYYRENSDELANVSPSLWKSVTDFAIAKVQAYKRLTKFLESQRGPAKTIAFGEVFTDAVVAPVALALGMPWLAAKIAAAPLGVMAGTGHFMFNLAWGHIKLSRRLGNVSLFRLRRLRKEIVGFNVKQHLASVVYQGLMNDTQLSLLIDFVRESNVESNFDSAIIVSLEEMETVVESKGHKYKDKRNSDLYFAQMMNDIVSDPALLNLFNQKLAEKVPTAVPSESGEARSLILEFSFLNKKLDLANLELKEIMNTAAAARKRSKINIDLFGPQSAAITAEEYWNGVPDLKEELEFAEFKFLSEFERERTKFSAVGTRKLLDNTVQTVMSFHQRVNRISTISQILKNGALASDENIFDPFPNKTGPCEDLLSL